MTRLLGLVNRRPLIRRFYVNPPDEVTYCYLAVTLGGDQHTASPPQDMSSARLDRAGGVLPQASSGPQQPPEAVKQNGKLANASDYRARAVADGIPHRSAGRGGRGSHHLTQSSL